MAQGVITKLYIFRMMFEVHGGDQCEKESDSVKRSPAKAFHETNAWNRQSRNPWLGLFTRQSRNPWLEPLRDEGLESSVKESIVRAFTR